MICWLRIAASRNIMVFYITISGPHQQMRGNRGAQNREVSKSPSSNFHLPLQLCRMSNFIFEDRLVHTFQRKGVQFFDN